MRRQPELRQPPVASCKRVCLRHETPLARNVSPKAPSDVILGGGDGDQIRARVDITTTKSPTRQTHGDGSTIELLGPKNISTARLLAPWLAHHHHHHDCRHLQTLFMVASAQDKLMTRRTSALQITVQLVALLVMLFYAAILIHTKPALAAAASSASPRIQMTNGAHTSSRRSDYIIVRTERNQMFQGIKMVTGTDDETISSSGYHDGHTGKMSATGEQMEPSEANDDVVAFLGIRYASPPIKRLRFMPPTQFNYAPNQVNRATQFGPICMQRLPIDLEAAAAAAPPLGRRRHHHQRSNSTDHNHKAPQAEQLLHNPVAQPQSDSSHSQQTATPSSSAATSLFQNYHYLNSSQQTEASGQSERSSSGGGKTFPPSSFELQMNLMEKFMAKSLATKLRPLIRRLIEFEQAEDCLNLNVYTPIEALGPTDASPAAGDESARVRAESWRHQLAGAAQAEPTGARSSSSRLHQADDRAENNTQTKLRPVLVIIHGDSFDFGSGSALDPVEFVRENRLLVITFNYRLNILGFPPRLSGSASFANLGFLDQVAALHWIRANVASFGGSPSDVTLLGAKEGAIFVNLLMLSPLAKGLFKRAIIEDGSALSPQVANQINWSTGRQQQQAPGLDYIRLLAKLCDCPVAPTAAQLVNQKQHQQQPPASPGGGGGGNNTVAHTRHHHHQQQQPVTQVVDELRTNGQMLDCLRHKPVDQVMQRIPLDLLQFDLQTQQLTTMTTTAASGQQSSGSTTATTTTTTTSVVVGGVSLQARWLHSVGLLHQEARLSPTLSHPSGANNSSSPSLMIQQAAKQQQPSHSSALSSRQLQELIKLATGEQMNRLRASLSSSTDGRGDRANDDDDHHDHDHEQLPLPSLSVQLELDQLFGAIYLAPNDTIRPLFGPQFDAITMSQLSAGDNYNSQQQQQQHQQQMSSSAQQHQQQLINNNHNQQQQQQQQQTDLASAMLSRDSQFGLHDLLIGLSFPIISHHHHHSSSRSESYLANKTEESILLRQLELESGQFELRPGHPMASKLTEQVQQSGLSDDQAIRLINSFVSPFYRYHQQEITNSIMNHYLTSSTLNNWLARHQHQQSQANNKQQTFVLDSLLESFQDALINVPLIKTALIHAARQLETLAQVFVGQQVQKLNRISAGQQTTTIIVDDNNNNNRQQQQQQQSLISSSLEENLTNEKFLLDAFILFAKSAFQQLDWPLELKQLPNSSQPLTSDQLELLQPHSTFLYQLDASLAYKWVQRTIWSLERRIRATNKRRTRVEASSVLPLLIIEKLSKLLSRLRQPDFRHQLSFGCAFDLINNTNNDEDLDKQSDQSDRELYLQFKTLLCKKLGNLLSNFITTGNVNRRGSSNNFKSHRSPANDTQFGYKIGGANYEQQLQLELAKCLHEQPPPPPGRVDEEENSRQKASDSNEDHHSIDLSESSSSKSATEDEARGDSFMANVHVQHASANSRRSLQLNCKRKLNQLILSQLLASEQDEQSNNGQREGDDDDERWMVFNVFDQQIATLIGQRRQRVASPEDLSQYWHLSKIVDDNNEQQQQPPAQILATTTTNQQLDQEPISGDRVGQINQLQEQPASPKSVLAARLSFWSNFISALNCSRTQTIIPTSLLSSTNSTLLNLNLVQVNCNNNNNNHHQQQQQTGATSATNINNLLATLGAQIKRQLQDQFGRFQMLKPSTQSRHQSNSSLMQNHHSLRMANVSQHDHQVAEESTATTTTTTSSSSGSISTNDLLITTNQFGSSNSSLDLLTPSERDGDRADEFASSKPQLSLIARFKLLFYNNNNHYPISRLMGLLASVLLVSLTLASASCAIVQHTRRRRNQQKQRDQDTQMKNSNHKGGEQSATKHEPDQPLDQGFQLKAARFEQQHPYDTTTTTKMSALGHRQSWTDGGDIVGQHHLSAAHQTFNCWLPNNENQQQQSPLISVDHVQAAGACQMHSIPSSSSLSSTSLVPMASGGLVAVTTSGDNCHQQQPIMMPILANAQANHCLEHQLVNCDMATTNEQQQQHQDLHLDLDLDLQPTAAAQQLLHNNNNNHATITKQVQFDEHNDNLTTSSTTATATSAETATTSTNAPAAHHHHHHQLSQQYQSAHTGNQRASKLHQTRREADDTPNDCLRAPISLLLGPPGNLLVSSLKKRVKISDPLATNRAIKQHQQRILQQQQQQQQQQPYQVLSTQSGSSTSTLAGAGGAQHELANGHQSLLVSSDGIPIDWLQHQQHHQNHPDSTSFSDNSNYCPIHRPASGQLTIGHNHDHRENYNHNHNQANGRVTLDQDAAAAAPSCASDDNLDEMSNLYANKSPLIAYWPVQQNEHLPGAKQRQNNSKNLSIGNLTQLESEQQQQQHHHQHLGAADYIYQQQLAVGGNVATTLGTLPRKHYTHLINGTATHLAQQLQHPNVSEESTGTTYVMDSGQRYGIQ